MRACRVLVAGTTPAVVSAQEAAGTGQCLRAAVQVVTSLGFSRLTTFLSTSGEVLVQGEAKEQRDS